MTPKARFAVSLHILAYLAHRAGAAVPSPEIAGSAGTHPVVIRRNLAALVRAGLVQARKGVAGGFSLAVSPDRISLRDIYHAVDPRPELGLKHFAPNPRCPVGARIAEVLAGTLDKARAAAEGELARISLAEIGTQLRVAAPARNRPT